MSEPGPVIPERAQGRRGTTSGDRLMVLLAVVTLLGGAAILVGNVFGPDADESARASATPGPRASLAATPSVQATPGVASLLQVEPGEPPPVGGPPGRQRTQQFYVRALERLPIHLGEPAGPDVGSVEPGQVVVAEEFGEPGWLRVMEPRPLGYIMVSSEATALAEVTATSPPARSSISMLAGGGNGFVGAVRSPEGDAVLVSSADGVTWTPSESAAADLFPEYAPTPVWGPAGWLSLQDDLGADSLWLWTSVDGAGWQSPGRLLLASSQRVEALVGSPEGYLLVLRAAADRTWWTSANGLAWSEIDEPAIEPGAWLTFAAGSQGVYLWDGRPRDCQLPTCGPSRDVGAGPTPGYFHSWTQAGWQTLADGPGGIAAHVVFLPDAVVGMDQDLAGTVRAWTGSSVGGGLSWGTPSAPEELSGSALATLTGDGSRAVAITWDRATDEISTWRTADGLSWDAVPAPPGGLQIIPHNVVGSNAGLLVGSIPAADSGQDPRAQTWWQETDARPLWKLTDSGWEAVTSTLLFGPEPPVAPCPDLPADGLDFVLLDPSDAVRCFGEAEITFRAYSVLCNACYRYLPNLAWEPEWLAPQSHGLFLAPMETGSTPIRATAFDPSLEESPAWTDTWVEVTGHFDDAAAQGCRELPDTQLEASYPGRAVAIDFCRRRFVVTEVVVLDG